MAQCVSTVPLVVDGVEHIGLVVSDAPCTQFVLLEPGEFAHITANPFVLTIEQGVGLSVAIAAVWALAWGWKAVSGVVKDDGTTSTE